MNTSFQRTDASDEWYTPREIIDALGEFQLDPCAPLKPLWPTAAVMWNKEYDGLSHEWGGVRVWCNPPYSQPLMTLFCEKMVKNNNGILLTFARCDNALFQNLLLPNCDAVLFLRHRIRFYLPDGSRGGSPGCGSVLIAFGESNVSALQSSGLSGFLMNKNGRWQNVPII